MNMHAPGLLNPLLFFWGSLLGFGFDILVYYSLFSEWSGEVRSVTYSPDGNTVTVAYRVTLYGTDAEVFPFLLFQCYGLIWLAFSSSRLLVEFFAFLPQKLQI